MARVRDAVTGCPELGILESKPWPAGVRNHVAGCGSCKLVMELIDERSQAAASRDRRTECARFEALIAVRAGTDLHGAAKSMLDEHLAICTDCRAIADTMAPADRPADHLELPAVDPNAYALGAEVARGGMGRILAARDLRIGRTVAVKELLAKSASLAARFEREARVTARLQHPGIVPIYEIGRFENGTPFYSMRLVEGTTLRAALAERDGLEARLALLPSVIAAAEAVAFAHAHQVVHRDLTPANVMVGEYGETVVIDWGLAKDLSSESSDEADVGPYRRDPSAASDLTAAGAVLGTAAYMPPEQAAGERVDARADVYSIGAILYHLLAGQAPFKGSNDDVLGAVQREPPAPLPATAPRDLASIVTKAMAKDPADRYPSAKEVAAELTAFQAGRLVGAHEYTRGELIRRWVRKRRGILAVTTLAVLALVGFGLFAIRRIVHERDVAEEERATADQQRMQSQSLSTTLLIEQGRQELLAGQHERAAALLAEAYLAAPDDVVVRQLLGFAMRRLEASERLQPPRITGAPEIDGGARIQISPDGKKYALRLADRLWLADARENAPLVSLGDVDAGDFPHFSADSHYVAAAKDRAVNVWDASGRRVREIPLGRPASWIGFSPDAADAIVLAADGGWGVWEIATGERLRFVEPPTKSSFARPGGTPMMATVGELFPVVTDEGNVVIWDWRRGVQVASFEHGDKSGLPTPFSSDLVGDSLITCGTDGKIKRWDVRTGRLLATMVESTGAIATCALAPDGRVASSSITGATRVWSAAGVVTLSFEDEPGGIVRFSPDSSRLVIQSGMSRYVSIRDAATGTSVVRLGQSGIVSMLAERLYLLRFDGAVDSVALRELGVAREISTERPGRFPEIDRDGRRMIADAEDGGVVLHDLQAGTQTRLPITRPCSLSDDGSHIVGWGERGITIVRATGEIEHVIATPRAPLRLAIADDHRQVVAKFIDGNVSVWDVTGRQLGTLTGDGHDEIGLDHGRVVLTTQFGSWDLWDPATGKQTRIVDTTWLGSFSRDGKLAASSDGDGLVVVVDTYTGERKLVVPGGSFAVFDDAGSVFVRNEAEVSRWATSTWTRSGRFPVAVSVTSTLIATDPTGSLVATSAGIWDTRLGRQLAAFDRGTIATQHNGQNIQAPLDFVAFSGDGDELRIQTSSGVRVWDVRPERRTPVEVAAIVARRQPWRVVDGQLTLQQARDVSRRATWIRGRAIHRGKPVVGGGVIDAVSGQYRQVATTGADGTFELFRKPGHYTITVHDKQRSAFGTADLSSSEHPDLVDIPLIYEASIAGRVIDRSGRPFAYAAIGAATESDSGDATTGADGTFRIGPLHGSLEYTVRIVDVRTGTPLHTRDPLPQKLRVADATTHVEGLEIVVDDDPIPATDQIDSSVFNRLSTRWQPSRSLDVINEGDASSRLVMQPTGAFSGQLWKLTPVGASFRLTTQWQGDAKPLGVDGLRPRLVKSSTPTWRIEKVVGGAYRIKPAGDPRCLAGGLQIALAPCADTADQQWLLTPTTARTR